jgi:hypothetical protein
MTRSLARIALVAALMVGVIAMHSFGHRGHTEESGAGAESAVVMVHHHMAHGLEGHDAEPDVGADEVVAAHGSVAAATELGSDALAPAHGSDAAVIEHGSDQVAPQNDPAEAAPRLGSAATASRHGSVEMAPSHNFTETAQDPVEPVLAHGSAATTPEHDSSPEHDPRHALSMLGFMICGAVLLRVAFEVLRKFWPRLLEVLASLIALPAFRAARTRFRYPPPLLRPTALLLNRIAVLRI